MNIDLDGCVFKDKYGGTYTVVKRQNVVVAKPYAYYLKDYYNMLIGPFAIFTNDGKITHIDLYGEGNSLDITRSIIGQPIPKKTPAKLDSEAIRYMNEGYDSPKKVLTGPRGGKYTLVKGKKVYR